VIHTNKDKLLDGVTYYSHEQLGRLKDVYATVYIISAHIPKKGEEKTEERLFDVNVRLVEQVVKQFESAKIVYASTVSIYGESSGILDEKSPSTSPNTYGLSKWWGEQIVRKAKRYAIVRISSMYGEGMYLETFLPRMIKQAIAEEKLTVWGDGARQQNYIWVADVAGYLIAAAKHPTNETYLGVDQNSYSNLEVAKMVQAHCGCPIVFFGEDRSKSYYYDNKMTTQQLNYSPKYKLEYHIPRLIEWIKKM
jgi:UDP-glucose 4-epimerase